MKGASYLLPALAGLAWSATTDMSHNDELVEVDIGQGLYSCDSLMSLFDSARDECLDVGCSADIKPCDSFFCVSIDGTTNAADGDTFGQRLDELRTVIAGACEEKPYDGQVCNPFGVCGPAPRVKVHGPSFLGTSTSDDDGNFVSSFKVTFSLLELLSDCDTITNLLNAGIGALPGGSLFGPITLLCG